MLVACPADKSAVAAALPDKNVQSNWREHFPVKQSSSKYSRSKRAWDVTLAFGFFVPPGV